MGYFVCYIIRRCDIITDILNFGERHMSLSKIIAYNVQFGDCVLLVFQQHLEKYMLLVDFGTRPAKIFGETRHKRIENWKKISELISEEMEVNGISKLDFLLTHLHEDHYNGLKYLNAKIDKVYVGMDLLQYKKGKKLLGILGEDVIIKCISKGICELHRYNSGDKEIINVLWPNKVILSDSFKQFVKDNFVNEFMELETKNLYTSIKDSGMMNYTSVVFEATGIDGEKYLFTGDMGDSFSVYYNRFGMSLSPISSEVLSSMRGKYKFIKMPHHGEESWPVKEGLLKSNEGFILISWGNTRDHSHWSTLRGYTGKIYATNVPEDFSGDVVTCGSKKFLTINISDDGCF